LSSSFSESNHDNSPQPIEAEAPLNSEPSEELSTKKSTLPIDEKWALFREVTINRPTELPEPAYLPTLPEPHVDNLWPPSHDTLFVSQADTLIDFLATEKEQLTFKPITPLPPDSTWKTLWAIVREVGETIILTLIIFMLIQLVIRNFRVVGTSMVDNLHDGQYLIIDKVMYNPILTDVFGIGGLSRGDVIVFVPPNRPEDDYVKRIIGLPGETVEVINGQIYINGQLLAEPFQPRTGSYTMPPVTVEPGRIFVLGDNRNNSNDSHNWGTLPIENIVGRAWISYWPPSEWGTIPRDRPSSEATLQYLLQGAMHRLVPGANANENSTIGN